MKKTPKRKRAPAPAAPPEPSHAEPLAVVGIGASAGGLEALQAFFERAREDSGLAFVVVDHRDPSHRGLLVEILQRSSRMNVSEATDGETVAANHVYVIPANRDLLIAHGRLSLLEISASRGQRLPIDAFFRSLADDCRERAIGVVVSGMGSDGTLGLRAIKENAGVAFVQQPASAKFEGMPRSAIEAGLADVVAPVEELPERILAYVHRRNQLAPDPSLAVESSTLDRIFVLLRAITGNDFSQYKRSTLVRRIGRRMGLHEIDGLDRYLRYLRENLSEAELLAKELLIGVTNFFRDAAAWDRLEREVLPSIVHARQGSVIRAWVAGCSTGEEAYSLAIVLREMIDKMQPSSDVRVAVFATDLDRDAIEKARIGAYPANVAADLTPERLRRFFVQEERGYRVVKDIREMVIFAPQNVIMDPPFTKLDVLSCRNVLIYLSPDVQKKIIPLFHYSLNPGGVLFLGNAETIGGYANLFVADDAKSRIYRRIEPVDAPSIEFPSTFSTTAVPAQEERAEGRSRSKSPPNLQAVVERVILDRHAPAAVLTTEKGDILYISGRTGKFLEPAAGKANWNVFAMARDGLRYELSGAFTRALRQDGPLVMRGVELGTKAERAIVDMSIEKLSEPEALRGRVLVVFTDAPKLPKSTGKRAPHAQRAVAALQDELRRARQEAQNLREQMQTSEEELKSANEELQSTNEELQSTNEELTTSKEELQSLNEELQTVNHELQSKLDELSRSNNDMTNLLNSTDIATLFLDGELRVRRFTTRTAKLIKLIPGDAGRPITDIATALNYADLADDAREVLRTLVFHEQLASARGGAWYTVRILPYRTIDNVIDGVVITFTDASATKKLEASLREQASQLRQLAESLPNLVFGCQANGTCDYLNSQWLKHTGVQENEQLGHRWLEQVDERDRERLRRDWGEAVQNKTTLDTEARIRGPNGTSRWFKIRAVAIVGEDGAVSRWYGSCTDVDDLKRAAAGVRP